MPFTPLHMGPALTAKAVSPGFVSLIVYGTAQIMMDLQPLAALTVAPAMRLHGESHTLVGALVLGMAAAVIGKYLGEWVLNVFRRKVYEKVEISWGKALGWGVGGALLHMLMDGLVYADMQPFWPFLGFTEANPMLRFGVTGTAMTVFCVYTGLAGLLVYGVARLVQAVARKAKHG